jgi:predicted ribosome quality control (RQC) complex YloA/Tae2 family protein
MELSGIELRYLINEIKKKVSNGYYVSNVYAVTRNSIVLKLHHPTEPDIMLAISDKGIWITKYKFDTMEESELIDVLRREVVRAKADDIQQFGSERIVSIKFSIDSNVRNLIAEFFAGGNIILCDESMKILAILNPVDVRHRVLKVNANYAYPPTRGIDVLDLKLEQLKAMRSSDLDVTRWIGRNIALPKKFVEYIVKNSGLELNAKCSSLKEDNVDRLYRDIVDLVADVCNGNHKPILVMQDNVAVDASPLPLQEDQGSIEHVGSYMEAVDTILSNYLKGIGESVRASEFAGKIAELERAINEQDKAKAALIDKSVFIRNFADALMALTKRGASSVLDSSVEQLLKENNAKMYEERGSTVLSIKDEKLSFKNTKIPSVASLLYSRAKELEKGTKSIDTAKNQILKELDSLKRRSEVAKKKISVQQLASKEWYERYRWFVTIDGLFAVGGRDTSSNSALVRRHLTDNDIVFHAEIHGSPFFILKNAKGDEAQSINQVAQATASFSRAWKEGLFTVDAYWVRADQMKKAAPSGQYLPKGAFVIEGKRNYIKGLELRLAIGLVKIKEKLTLMCGAPDSVKRNSLFYILIAPNGTEVSEVAKKIKAEFVKIAGDELSDFAKSLSLDEIIRAIPSGKSKIVYAAKGEAGSGIDIQQKIKNGIGEG